MLGAEGGFCPKLRKLFGAKGVRSWEGWDRLKWFFLKYRETELSEFVPRLGSSRSCSRSTREVIRAGGIRAVQAMRLRNAGSSSDLKQSHTRVSTK